MRVVNLVVGWILRAPLLHRLLGGLALITVTGRRTGRRYTTPVQAVTRDGHVFLVSRQGRTWWRNLRGGGPVALRIGGRARTGRGSVVTGLDDIRRAQAVFDGSSLAGAARRPDAVIVEVVLD